MSMAEKEIEKLKNEVASGKDEEGQENLKFPEVGYFMLAQQSNNIIQMLNDANNNINNRFDSLHKEIKDLSDKTDARFETIRKETDTRFDKVDAKFDAVYKDVKALSDKTDARFDKVDARFDKLNDKFNYLQRWTFALIVTVVLAFAAIYFK